MTGSGDPGPNQPSVGGEVDTSVVVLGYGEEPHLIDCLAALTGQLGPSDEVILVDNGITGATATTARGLRSVRHLGDGRNLGFAGGCRLGAEQAGGDVLVFVNSDAIVRPGAIERIAAALREHLDRGLVSGCLRLADQPELINSVGNPLQFLGLTWAGHCGEPATEHARPGPVTVATGGLFGVRREVWRELRGFDERYFAYHEDTDLSLRCWLSGRPVVVEPAAVADHHYEFSRNPRKFYLLERNRWITVLTDYPPRLLAVVLPALLAIEPALLAMAVAQGWAKQKLRAWWWLVGHAGALRARRRRVQADVTASDADIAALLVARIEPPMITAPPGTGVLNTLLAGYWRLASGLLGVRSAGQSEQLDDQTGRRAGAQTQRDASGQVHRQQ